MARKRAQQSVPEHQLSAPAAAAAGGGGGGGGGTAESNSSGTLSRNRVLDAGPSVLETTSAGPSSSEQAPSVLESIEQPESSSPAASAPPKSSKRSKKSNSTCSMLGYTPTSPFLQADSFPEEVASGGTSNQGNNDPPAFEKHTALTTEFHPNSGKTSNLPPTPPRRSPVTKPIRTAAEIAASKKKSNKAEAASRPTKHAPGSSAAATTETVRAETVGAPRDSEPNNAAVATVVVDDGRAWGGGTASSSSTHHDARADDAVASLLALQRGTSSDHVEGAVGVTDHKSLESLQERPSKNVGGESGNSASNENESITEDASGFAKATDNTETPSRTIADAASTTTGSRPSRPANDEGLGCKRIDSTPTTYNHPSANAKDAESVGLGVHQEVDSTAAAGATPRQQNAATHANDAPADSSHPRVKQGDDLLEAAIDSAKGIPAEVPTKDSAAKRRVAATNTADNQIQDALLLDVQVGCANDRRSSDSPTAYVDTTTALESTGNEISPSGTSGPCLAEEGDQDEEDQGEADADADTNVNQATEIDGLDCTSEKGVPNDNPLLEESSLQEIEAGREASQDAPECEEQNDSAHIASICTEKRASKGKENGVEDDRELQINPREKLVVRCSRGRGGKFDGEQGNIAYRRELFNYQRGFPKANKQRRKSIVDTFLAKFSFVLEGEEMSEERAKAKVVSALSKRSTRMDDTQTESAPGVVGRSARDGLDDVAAAAKQIEGSWRMDDDTATTSGGTETCDQEPTGEASASHPDAPQQKLTVYCGKKHHSPGNDAYQRELREHRPMYLEAGSTQESKTTIVEIFLAKYTFVKGETNEEVPVRFAIDKIRKSLGDIRLLQKQNALTSKAHMAPRKRAHSPEARTERKRRRKSTRWPRSDEDMASESSDTDSEYAEPPPKKESLHLRGFSDGDYIEEVAYHHFANLAADPDFDFQELEPMRPPFPVPELPEDGEIKWRWKEDDPNSRILIADMKGVARISPESKKAFAQMLDRTEFTVLSEGMVENLDRKIIERELRAAFPCNAPYHQFRHFVKTEDENGFALFTEQDGSIHMGVEDFLKYLKETEKTEEEMVEMCTAYDGDHAKVEINPRVDILYATDLDMPKLLHRVDARYKKNFKIPEMLPGGEWCMMNNVPVESRPFMGPNLYVSPGGGYTQLHQDGHGTVESGHTVVAGFNEVVMLRRLPEVHKMNACMIMPGIDPTKPLNAENILYGFPHDDTKEGVDKPLWPTKETIQKFEDMGYCPMVFIAEEGQHVHIPSGCLHIFRKLRIEKLPEDDCHCELRAALVEAKDLKFNPCCISVALDWMLMGSSAGPINRQFSSIIECASLCRQNDRTAKTLAIPEACVLKLASEISAISPDDPYDAFEEDSSTFRPNRREIARGILPTLRYIVERETAAVARSKQSVEQPDSHVAVSSTNPYGNDYFCRICDQELSSTYFHCDGCEKLLHKDYDICTHCFEEGRFRRLHRMHPTANQATSDLQHTGNCKRKSSPHQCNCRVGACKNCFGYRCKQCSCTCHQKFTPKCRFFLPEHLEYFLKQCEEYAGEEVLYAEETLLRLKRQPMVPTRLPLEPVNEEEAPMLQEPENEQEEAMLQEPEIEQEAHITQNPEKEEEAGSSTGAGSKVFELETLCPTSRSN